MKTIKINKISKRQYNGYVYNMELQGENPSKDDLFWIEQDTGIVTHNCFPKDLNAMIVTMEQNGVDPLLLKAVWAQNKKVRKNWDWKESLSAVRSKKGE